VVKGDSGVGKTSLVNQFVRGIWGNNLECTIGVDYLVKDVELESGEYRVEVSDTPGNDRFRAIDYRLRSAHCVIIVYDITYKESFDHVAAWIEETKNLAEDIAIVVAGNKNDMESHRAVETSTAVEYTKALQVPFFEVSAKTSQNVQQLFHTAVEEVLRCQPSSFSSLSSNKPNPVHINEIPNQGLSHCC